MSAATALNPAAVIGELERRGIRYILSGSVAAMAWGVDLDPGDIDIVPDLDAANLRSLGALLHDVGAKPKYVTGWAQGPSEEACARWTPEPFDAAALDHRFLTPWGELDVVPTKSGTYDALHPRAVTVEAFGVRVRVVHIEDLIAQGASWDRPRDQSRREALVAARERHVKGEALPPLDRHPAWARMGA